MKVIVINPTIIGGVDYQPTVGGEYTNIPDQLAQHMIDIGNAIAYETKVVEVVEKKSVPETISVSQPAPALPKKTRKPRKARKPAQ